RSYVRVSRMFGAACLFFISFFFHDPATTEIYTLSLHDALPIWPRPSCCAPCAAPAWRDWRRCASAATSAPASCGGRCCASRVPRSEEHTSELQSRENLVCRLLLEKKKRTVTPEKAARHSAQLAS